MDPLWASVAEFWWIAPAVVGAGGLGWLGLRIQRAENARRLEYDASRLELRDARSAAAAARLDLKVTRTELARLEAERRAARATPADVQVARREVLRAEREARSASATVRARRTQVRAARGSLPADHSDPAALPLARLMTAHDAVLARWLQYETDPARLIAFPTMSDGRHPLTAAFLAEQTRANQLRPASAKKPITPKDYAAYRDAVRRLERAFAVAEAEALRLARAAGTLPAEPQPAPASDLSDLTLRWREVAQTVAQSALSKSAAAITRMAESGASAMKKTTDAAGSRDPAAPASTRDAPAGPARAAQPTHPSPPPSPQPAPQPAPADPVWPVPRRSTPGAPPSASAGS